MFRERLLSHLAGLSALLLVAALGWRAWSETGGIDSYALLADAFLNGRLGFAGCFDNECVHVGSRMYLVQPPFPAVVVTPFVAVSGLYFHRFILVAAVLVIVSLWLWKRIFERIGADPEVRDWLLIAMFTSTPLMYAALRADGVWLFAHVVGFTMATLAVHEALAGRLVTTGLAIGAAFLSRQMSLFLLPFLFALTLTERARFLPPSGETISKALRLGLAFAIPFGIYLAYNWARFGNPLETGHSILAAEAPTSVEDTIVTHRLIDIGVFSTKYVVYNFFYTFVQGFHVDFDPRVAVKLVGMDPSGSSILASSPFLLFLFFMRRDRVALFGGLSVALIMGLFFVYHSNGFKQYNVQRYLLDYLPVLMVFMTHAVRREHLPIFKLLVVWGALLQVATVVVLALTKV